MSDQPTQRPERKYRMIRVKAGVYLLPSNDAKTLWRISAYTEYGDGWWEFPGEKPKQIKGEFWETARRPMPEREIPAWVDMDGWLWDGDAWEHWSMVHPTRQDAIDEVLRV